MFKSASLFITYLTLYLLINIECFIIPQISGMEKRYESIPFIPHSKLNVNRRTSYNNLFDFDLLRDKRFGNTRYGRNLNTDYSSINNRNLQQLKKLQIIPDD
ncbi:unnamed protein product [Didymodactylos carnosus]|uniref:Uncharacterized protein n=1 Tax=Didymodactylos carnosus TaxID=1234261 RepID=A0A814PVL3_9BILA|nr:unnamed protein product [Didymodactylos carnosus]CAF3875395.1 unnamed protein product [Didymodactylos carnosus]